MAISRASKFPVFIRFSTMHIPTIHLNSCTRTYHWSCPVCPRIASIQLSYGARKNNLSDSCNRRIRSETKKKKLVEITFCFHVRIIFFGNFRVLFHGLLFRSFQMNEVFNFVNQWFCNNQDQFSFRIENKCTLFRASSEIYVLITNLEKIVHLHFY